METSGKQYATKRRCDNADGHGDTEDNSQVHRFKAHSKSHWNQNGCQDDYCAQGFQHATSNQQDEQEGDPEEEAYCHSKQVTAYPRSVRESLPLQ